MKLSGFIGACATLAVLSSCGNNQSHDNSAKSTLNLAEFTNSNTPEKKSFFLRIVDEQIKDSSVVYTAKSIFNQDTIGLKFEFKNDIPAGVNADGSVNEQTGFSEGSIRISSIGKESDAFVKALSESIATGNASHMTTNEIIPSVFSSNQKEVNLSKVGTYNFKLFIPNATGLPAELFFTLDTYKKAIEFSEKDSTYRAGLISAFTHH